MIKWQSVNMCLPCENAMANEQQRDKNKTLF